MIVGTVNIDGVPVIILTVAGQTWPATIDTGFNSEFTNDEASYGFGVA